MSRWRSSGRLRTTTVLALGLALTTGSWTACAWVSREDREAAPPPEAGASPVPGPGLEPDPVFSWPEPAGSARPAARLWAEARRLYEQHRYENAVVDLQKLFDRFPGYPDARAYHELRLLLGRSYLKLGRYEQAVSNLRSYLEAPASPRELQHARVYLGEAYWRMGRPEEAYLASREILDNAPLPPRIEAHALLLRAKALISLGNDAQAQLALGAARRLADTLRYSNLLGPAAALSLQLKLRACSRPARGGPGGEARSIQRIRQQGDCLNEAIADYERSLEAGYEPSARQAQRMMSGAITGYDQACGHPSPPPHPGAPPFTERQRASYVSELASRLRKICDKRLDTSLLILRNWKATNPPPAATRRAAELEREIEGRIHRPDARKDTP